MAPDLGVADAAFNLRNDPYWNLGCSVRSNMAAQVADPVDLVRGRTESAPDTIQRTKNIEAIRQGQDPQPSTGRKGRKSTKRLETDGRTNGGSQPCPTRPTTTA